MTILPEVEQRLVEAVHRRSRERARQPRRPRRRTRALLLALAMLVITGSAVAATRPWAPLLGKPSVDGASPRASAAAVTEEQRRSLAVLRRPQTARDRRAAALGLLTSLAPTTDGVHLDGVRLLSPGTDAPAVALVPVARVFKRYKDRARALLARDVLCLADRDDVVCATAGQVAAGTLTGSNGRFSFGLVPDGVATVRIRFAGGEARSIPVRDNFYGTTLKRLPAPRGPGTDGPALLLQRDPATVPPQAPATVTWLDAAGAAVGPVSSGP